MGWAEMQAVFAARYASEIADVMRGGGKAVVLARLAGLSDEQRHDLLDCLTEPA